MVRTYFYNVIILLSVVALALAYVGEYIAGLEPCPLCIYQRFPYLVLIFISIIAANQSNDDNKLYGYSLFITIIMAIILTFYHSGIERGFFEVSGVCKPLVKIGNDISADDFKKILSNQKIASCNRPSLIILHLSLTEWNLVLNVILFAFCIRIKHKKSLYAKAIF